MYSAILLLSMTTAPETPQFGGLLFKGGHGCNSSCQGCYSSGNGCYASGQGCYGSGQKGGYGACYGGCNGYGIYGGYGTLRYSGPQPTGGYWFYPTYNCHGYGVYGGATYAWPTPYIYGGGSCYGYGLPIVPVYPKIEEKKKEDGGKKEDPKKTMLPASPNQGRVVVSLPEDAKLFANGQLTALTSGLRDFNTPNLERGRDFQYTMQIEYVRDGKTITDSQVVKVRAGAVSVVEFADPSKPELVASTVKVNLPEGAKLFVDDQAREMPASKEFLTPRLQKGSEYAYNFRAELTKEGKTHTQNQRVVFKAGEPISVDFSEMNTTRTASR